MARNKYPELTVEKILDVAQRLFLEKGYDQTTIQDIVDELGGLTKGAVYHHFKSKEEIMNALGDRMFLDNNPFSIVKERDDLNGLQKLQTAIMLNQADKDKVELSKQTVPLLQNPRILAGMIESQKKFLTPALFELIEEGKKDGSIKTEYARELSELFPLLEIWLMPSIYPASQNELQHKFGFIKKVFEDMGVPIFNEQVSNMIDNWLNEVEKK